MSYDNFLNLNALDVATPVDGASVYEITQALRQVKAVLKTVLGYSHKPNGELIAGVVTSLADGTVTFSALLDECVTTPKLASKAVTTEKLADGCVTGLQLAAGAVLQAAYGDNSIPTSAYRASSIPKESLKDGLTVDQIGNSAIETAKIKNLNVTDDKISGMAVSKLLGGAAGQMLLNIAGTWTPINLAGALTYNSGSGEFEMPSTLSIMYFGDVKTSGTVGGSATSGTWIQRTINGLADPDSLATWDDLTFQLVEGTYLIHIEAPACNVGSHKVRLMKALVVDNTSPTVVAIGTSAASSSAQTCSILDYILTISDSLWYYYVEHWVQTAVGTSDFGTPCSIADTSEIYTTGYVIKF